MAKKESGYKWGKVKTRQILLSGGIAIFLLLLFLSYSHRLEVSVTQHQLTVQVYNPTVILEQPTLKVFDDTMIINPYPDFIRIHYPYLLVVEPYKTKTTFYNLETRQKIQEMNQAVLDFNGKNIMWTEGGFQTETSGLNLGAICNAGYLKDSKEALCITPINTHESQNKLTSVDLITAKKTDIYVPSVDEILTSVAYIDDTLYIGEVNTNTFKSSLVINGQVIPVEDDVNIIYPMNNKVYYASLKKPNNSAREAYYLIEKAGDGYKTTLQEVGKIVLYKE